MHLSLTASNSAFLVPVFNSFFGGGGWEGGAILFQREVGDMRYERHEQWLVRLVLVTPSGLTMPLSKHSEVTYPVTSSHATRQGTFGRSRLGLLSHCGLILA